MENFETFRNSDNSPMLLPLVKPIITSLVTLTNMETTSDDFGQEIRIRSLFAHLQILGKELDSLNQNEVDNLFDKIRHLSDFIKHLSDLSNICLILSNICVILSNTCLISPYD